MGLIMSILHHVMATSAGATLWPGMWLSPTGSPGHMGVNPEPGHVRYLRLIALLAPYLIALLAPYLIALLAPYLMALLAPYLIALLGPYLAHPSHAAVMIVAALMPIWPYSNPRLQRILEF